MIVTPALDQSKVLLTHLVQTATLSGSCVYGQATPLLHFPVGSKVSGWGRSTFSLIMEIIIFMGLKKFIITKISF